MHETPTNTAYFGSDLEALYFARNYNQWIYDTFSSYLGENIAEIGAGIGNFSNLIIQQNIRQLTAFEPSNNMYPILKKRIEQNHNVVTINSTFLEKHELFTASLDSIIYINVLEHIENDEYELQIAGNALHSGGYLLIFVPALSWLYSDFDEKIGHYRRYHKDQLARLIIKAGLDLVDIRYFDMAGIMPWYINFVLLKRGMSKHSVKIYDRYFIPVTKTIEKFINPPIGKNLLVIAQKK